MPVYGADSPAPLKSAPKLTAASSDKPKKPLIEEVEASSSSKSQVPENKAQTATERPEWSMSKLKDDVIRIDLELPKLVSLYKHPVDGADTFTDPRTSGQTSYLGY